MNTAISCRWCVRVQTGYIKPAEESAARTNITLPFICVVYKSEWIIYVFENSTQHLRQDFGSWRDHVSRVSIVQWTGWKTVDGARGNISAHNSCLFITKRSSHLIPGWILIHFSWTSLRRREVFVSLSLESGMTAAAIFLFQPEVAIFGQHCWVGECKQQQQQQIST